MRKQQQNENYSPVRVKRGRAVLVGYGLDEGDGHIRYTRCGTVDLYGGSDNAHVEMQKRALFIQTEMDKLGISLDGMTYEQYQLVQDIVERANCE